MAQRVDVNGTIVEFPDGMSQEAMAAALTKLPKPAQAPTAPATPVPVAAAVPAPTPAPTEVADQTGAAFGVMAKPFRRDDVLKARAAKVIAEEKEAIPFESVYTDPANLQKIVNYGTSRFGKYGVPAQGESSEEYVKRFMSHMRMLATGNEISSTQELQYLNSVNDEDKLKAKDAYDLFDKTAGYFSDKGQKGIKPVFDVLGSIVSSPTTALSLGAGKIATAAFMKEATKSGIKQATKATAGRLAAVPAIEATGAAASDVTQQKIELTGEASRLKQLETLLPTLSEEDQSKYAPAVDELRKKIEEGVSGTRVAASAVLGGALGTAETAALVKSGRTIMGKDAIGELDEILKQRITKTTELPKVEVPKEDATMKALEDQFDIFEGRKLLNKEGEPTSVAEMQIRNDVNQKAAQVAKEIWTRVPDLAPQQGQKISDAIKNVYQNIDNIDNVVLEDALAQAGITAQEFAQMNRTTIGDAGRTLQALSVLARLQNKLKTIDKAAAKEVDDMYGNRNALVDSFSGLYSGAQRLDRELKALMVSQVSTTIRNGYSTGTIVTIGAASEAIESALYRVGKSAVEVATGSPVTGTFTGGMKAVYDDAVRTTFYLGQQGLSSDVAEALLATSPALRNRILKTTSEAGTAELSKIGQYANTLNVAQDAFFRKAIFVSNVDKQLSRVGLNMYDILAQNKNVPFDILNNATEEALAATMSKMPTKGPLFYGVKFIESIPILGSTIAPFPRFMANALSWSYKHSPMNAFNGSIDIARGSSLLKQGDDKGNAYLSRGLENVSKSMVGTAAIYAAYKYRKEHQDTDWFDQEGPDGSRVDIRAFWPFGPFMAMGDWLVKFENGRTDEFKTGELLEAVSGFKAPAGTYAWLGDKFTEAASKFANSEESDNQKLNTFFGEWAGEYFGRALIPAAQLSDIIGAIDRDETLPRDAYQIPKGEEGFTSSLTQQVMKRVPVLKQQLPEYQPALREEAKFNDAGPLKILSGIAVKGKPNEIESEVERLKIDFRKVFTSTGDKVIDANARKTMATLVADNFDNLKNTDYYQTLSKDGQKIVLQNFLSWAQRTAKETAIKQDMAAASQNKEQSRIFSVQYDKLPPEVKRETAALYKEQTGEDLNITKDYMSALAMAKAIRSSPKFATGGLAGDIAGKVLGTAVKKSSTDLLKEMQEAALRKAVVPEAAPVAIKATPVVKKPVAAAEPTPSATMTNQTPATAAPEAPVARQMEEAMPTPIEAVPEAPMPNLVEDLQPPAFKRVDEYDIPEESIKFTDTNKADDFTDIDYNEDPTNNLFKDYSAYTEDILSKDNDVVGKTIDSFKGRKKLDDAIATVRKEREDAYSKISGSPDFLDFDPIVVSTALAKTREKVSDRLMTARNIPADKRSPFFAPEFDIENASAKEVDDFFKLASTEQKKLDQLRAKFETRPPVSLIHGQEEGTDTVTKLAKKGFMAPQGRAGKHAELNVGAPSFTKDPNINALIPKFGGADVKAYGSVNIPYGDYIYRRINMPASVYDEANPYGGQRPESALFTYNRAITGAPDDAVPISLPKGYHLESEDIFLEADKLKAMGFSRPSGRGGDKEALFRIQTAIGSKGSTLDNLSTISDTYAGILAKKDEKRLPSEVQVYSLYKDIRNLFKNEIGKSESVGVTGGAGSRYVNTIRGLATAGKDLTMVVDGTKYPITDALKTLESELDRLATRKNNTVLTEKANNIRQLRVSLENISKQTEGTPSAETISATSFRQGSKTDKIDGLKSEMSKLDQKISKEWDVDVIDDLKLDKEMLQDRIDVLKKAIVPSERTSKDKIMKLTDKLARGGLATRR